MDHLWIAHGSWYGSFVGLASGMDHRGMDRGMDCFVEPGFIVARCHMQPTSCMPNECDRLADEALDVVLRLQPCGTPPSLGCSWQSGAHAHAATLKAGGGGRTASLLTSKDRAQGPKGPRMCTEPWAKDFRSCPQAFHGIRMSGDATLREFQGLLTQKKKEISEALERLSELLMAHLGSFAQDGRG